MTVIVCVMTGDTVPCWRASIDSNVPLRSTCCSFFWWRFVSQSLCMSWSGFARRERCKSSACRPPRTGSWSGCLATLSRVSTESSRCYATDRRSSVSTLQVCRSLTVDRDVCKNFPGGYESACPGFWGLNSSQWNPAMSCPVMGYTLRAYVNIRYRGNAQTSWGILTTEMR